MLVLPFEFVNYIIKCTMNIKKQVTFEINQIKEGLALKVKPQIK
jgi:hypothetical protein